MENFDRSITDILVGNNIVNLAMGSISALLAMHSAREMMGVNDQDELEKLIRVFFTMI